MVYLSLKFEEVPRESLQNAVVRRKWLVGPLAFYVRGVYGGKTSGIEYQQCASLHDGS
jgi:hypothetical protein